MPNRWLLAYRARHSTLHDVESWGGRTKMSLRNSRLVASLGRVFGDEDARRDMTRLGEEERTDFGFDLAVFLTQLIDKT